MPPLLRSLVAAGDVAAVLSQWTGIPSDRMLRAAMSACERTLIAVRSPVRCRLASQTVPKPPEPIGSTSSYSLIETERALGSRAFEG